MAIGATDDPDLAARVGEAIGLEARAMGVNVVYAPVVDVATAPANAAIGIRSFGDDPARVAALGVAFLDGLRRAGVAAAVKHFPGLGDTDADTHHGLAIVRASRERLEAVDLVPFRAAIDAGVPIVMSSHVAVPALNDGDAVSSTLAPAVMTGLLRGRLGFEGVTISDALDMRAIAQGEAQAAAILAALRAGVDLLLCGPDRDAQERHRSGAARRRGRRPHRPHRQTPRPGLGSTPCAAGSPGPGRCRTSASSAVRRTRRSRASWRSDR